MYSIESATSEILESFVNHKSVYGSLGELPFGAGMVCGDIKYPIPNIKKGVFITVSGTVLVLTHECDIAPGNNKVFNEDILICPIIPFKNFFNLYKAKFPEEKLKSFLKSLSENRVNRMMYIPPHGQDVLKYGGLLFFNKICSTHRELIEKDDSAVCTLSAIGYDKLGYMLHNHLLRPKSVDLPLTRFMSPRNLEETKAPSNSNHKKNRLFSFFKGLFKSRT